jgi:hypothetical protein
VKSMHEERKVWQRLACVRLQNDSRCRRGSMPGWVGKQVPNAMLQGKGGQVQWAQTCEASIHRLSISQLTRYTRKCSL